VPLLSSQIPSRWYSASHASPADTEERVLKVLKNFDKVDISKLELTTPFTQLGLDSLDVVEVMIALEEEFHIEIPDPVADKVQNPKEIAEYIFGFMNPSRPAKHDKISEDESHH
jgi:NADH dehydrogenase (ubiquinone) 1 alpha/beta subcomplex 1